MKQIPYEPPEEKLYYVTKEIRAVSLADAVKRERHGKLIKAVEVWEDD